MNYHSQVSTGWESLDRIIDHLRRGDNVVWQVDTIEDYQQLVTPFVTCALSREERVVYMRFASHPPLLENGKNVAIYPLALGNGFESFSAEVHSIITREGPDVCYVFDSLSELLHVWATDLMIGDFFFITCPYLFELNTVAYFAIHRHRHSFKAIARIREITQVLIDVYTYEGQMCIHPIKVKHRYSPTMFFPHIMEEENLVPVINSVDATRVFSNLSRDDTASAHRHLDYWDRLFIEAEGLLDAGAPSKEKANMVEQLGRLMLSRNKRILSLLNHFLSLEDLFFIKERLIGTGFIGGKSVGMLLSRKILMEDGASNWGDVLEPHDSFFIGSDVFYSYIVQNGWWKLFMAHKTSEGYFSKASELKNKILHGHFPEEIMEKFQLMLEYFGQSPIIVRSSSLLEDDYGNAFAGKYDSFFCVNQGNPETRYENFETAVRRIYASTLGRDALAYRRQRGLEKSDEQMAILVQRVSGAYHKHYFFPELAGVGLSHNPFTWQREMDPKAGMVRLVLGLGTRAVNRVENDYPRIIAMDNPLVKPLAGTTDIRKFSQHFVDVLSLKENRMETQPLKQLIEDELIAHLDLMGTRDTEAARQLRQMGRPAGNYWLLTFDGFLTKTPFSGLMTSMLKKLEKTYQNPVDIEFTVNFSQSGELRINLLQCRPFQTAGWADHEAMPGEIPKEQALIRIEGNFMGGNIVQPISRVILVSPREYAALTPPEKFAVARLVGKLNRSLGKRDQTPTLLMGPGRWGTQSPEMGVPVKFSEINNIAAIAEISHPMGEMVPDLSFGTHFFHDLIETGIFYMAVYPENPGVVFNAEWFQSLPNQLERIHPAAARLGHIITVANTEDYGFVLASDVATQQVICYVKEGSAA